MTRNEKKLIIKKSWHIDWEYKLIELWEKIFKKGGKK